MQEFNRRIFPAKGAYIATKKSKENLRTAYTRLVKHLKVSLFRSKDHVFALPLRSGAFTFKLVMYG